jgi:hypothetical protein
MKATTMRKVRISVGRRSQDEKHAGVSLLPNRCISRIMKMISREFEHDVQDEKVPVIRGCNILELTIAKSNEGFQRTALLSVSLISSDFVRIFTEKAHAYRSPF